MLEQVWIARIERHIIEGWSGPTFGDMVTMREGASISWKVLLVEGLFLGRLCCQWEETVRSEADIPVVRLVLMLPILGVTCDKVWVA